MRTHVEVRSAAFPALPGEDEQINPGRFGRRLADFVRSALDAAGLPGGEPVAEDWGWLVPVDNPDFALWVGVGNVDGEAEEFLCFVEPRRPVVRRGLRKVATVERVGAVADALDAAFAGRPDIAHAWVEA